jgi:hypothetical protein
MTGLLVFIGASAALIIMLLLVVKRPAAGEEAPAGAPDRAIMERILAPEDAAYIASLRLPRVRRLFLRERRRLAVAWLRAIRAEATRLFGAHTRAVRQTHDLRPMTEVRVACSFALFMLNYAVIAGLVQWYGPFRTSAILRWFDSLSGAMERLSRQLAASAAAPASGAIPT